MYKLISKIARKRGWRDIDMHSSPDYKANHRFLRYVECKLDQYCARQVNSLMRSRHYKPKGGLWLFIAASKVEFRLRNWLNSHSGK